MSESCQARRAATLLIAAGFAPRAIALAGDRGEAALSPDAPFNGLQQRTLRGQGARLVRYDGLRPGGPVLIFELEPAS